MKCLIAGATGLVGGHLLNLLLDDQRVEKVISMGRRPVEIQNPKLLQLNVHFEALPESTDLDADVAFCCLGTTIKKAGTQQVFRKIDYDAVIAFAKFAQNAGVKHFQVVSSLGADSNSRIFYNRVKGEAERSLGDMNFKSTTAFRPSLLLGERKEKRLFESAARALYPFYRFLCIGPLASVKPIPAEVVAKAMLRYSLHPKIGSHVILNSEIFKLGK